MFVVVNVLNAFATPKNEIIGPTMVFVTFTVMVLIGWSVDPRHESAQQAT
jgi:riboflavin transporter FmnP